jgi:histidinol dehydrogenase
MKQIRKFEQEAIVNQIMEGVKERLDSKIEKAKKSKEYKALAKKHDSVSKLDMAIERMNKTRAEEVEALNEQIKNFNYFHTEENVGVSTVRFSHDELSWWKHEWQIKTQVADKLAVALIEDNAQERIKEIIMAIAKEVS